MPDRHARFLVLTLLAALASACDQPCPAGTVREPSGRCVVPSVDGGAPRPDGCSPRAERCGDLRDDDCDGLVDEGCGCELGATAPCGTDVGECSTGLLTCVMDAASSAGTWSECEGETAPETEVCNGLDDDCDGEIDGPAAWPSCGTAPGAVSLGCAFSLEGPEACRVVECAEGLRDCDDLAETGCEIDSRTDAAHCGGCGLHCEASIACEDCPAARVCEESSCHTLPRHRWSERVGGNGDDDRAYSIAIDSVGNVYAAGTFAGTLTLGSTSLVSVGGNDGFLASWTSDGDPRWAVRMGGSSQDLVYDVAIDGSDNVTVVGVFSSTGTFAEVVLTSVGASDAFVASYTSAGASRWAQRFGGADDDDARSLVAAADGAIVIGGAFQVSATFGGVALVSSGSSDGFLIGITGTGGHQWARQLGGSGFDTVRAVALDGAGAVLAAGHFSSSASVGASALASAGSTDVFVASFDSFTGSPRWSQRHGGPGLDEARALTVDTSGNVYLAASFYGTADFGGAPLVSAGGSDAALASYSASGAHRWSSRFGGRGEDVFLGIALSPPNRLYAVGLTASSGFYPVPYPGWGFLTPLGDVDTLLSALDLDGLHVWSARMGGAGVDLGVDVAAQGDRMLVAGGFSATATFDEAVLTSAGAADGFVASLRGR